VKELRSFTAQDEVFLFCLLVAMATDKPSVFKT